MGYSKNYIMYWGGFYGYYNIMSSHISVHKVYKFLVFFLYILYSTSLLYTQYALVILHNYKSVY